MTERGGMSLLVWNTMLLPDDVTLPGLLQKAGCTTGTVGKHHCIQWPKLEPTSPNEDARDPAVAAKLESNARKMEAALRALGFDFATNIISGNPDFAPTILDLAGVEQPKDFFDGRSFRPVLEGKASRVHDALFFELGFTRGVLKDNWKYIALRYPPNPETVVDLRKPEGGKGTKRPDPASPATLNPRPPFGHIGGNNNEDRPKKTYPAYWDADRFYDLYADPKEQRNMAKEPAHAAKLAELKQALRLHLAKVPGGFAELKGAE